MFDYIKIDEGANRLLMCILILAICWFLVKWKKRAILYCGLLPGWFLFLVKLEIT